MLDMTEGCGVNMSVNEGLLNDYVLPILYGLSNDHVALCRVKVKFGRVINNYVSHRTIHPLLLAFGPSEHTSSATRTA